MARKVSILRRFTILAGISILATCLLPVLAGADEYSVTKLVSDVSGLANYTDLDLKNPWGIASSATSPLWVSNNASGVATLYNGAGVKQGLVVTIPPPAGGTSSGTPTGLVFNGGSSFQVGPGNPAHFLFATQDGTISGWNSGTTAIRKVDNSGSSASYTGLALGNNGSGDFLYAANFSGGVINVFNSTFAPTTLGGSFTDPSLPSGYVPFNIQNLNGKLYVTYAPQSGTGGIVDVFDLNGNFLSRLAKDGALDSPWGLALSPANFGQYSNALLVANHGDGRINAFDPTSGVLLGTLQDAYGDIVIDGLWGLIFGNGGSGGDPNLLYFTAGPDGGTHGLFGTVAPVPIPGAVWLLGSGLLGLAASRRRKVPKS